MSDVTITRALRVLLFCLLACWSLAPTAHAASLPDGFRESRVVVLGDVTSMAFAPDGRLFVCTKSGQIRLIRDGVLVPAPIYSVVTDTNEERGLNGIAVDPEFAENGYLYIYYTAISPSIHNRVSRLTLIGDVVATGSEVVILDLDELQTSGGFHSVHNGGALQFGPDEKLYVGVGDDGNGANAQSLQTRLGKILRIEHDGSIPWDNPFFAEAQEGNKAIWAWGLRNPFTFDFDEESGRFHINDVGSQFFEEINLGTSGGNYGWPEVEGYSNDSRFTSPLHAYSRGFSGDQVGCAITGGTFYRQGVSSFPTEFLGAYFFLDYCSGWIRMLAGSAQPTIFAREIAPEPVALTLSPDGSLYYASRSSDPQLRGIYRIEYTGNLTPDFGAQPSDQRVAKGSSVTFEVRAYGSQPLTYQWQRDGVDIPGATSPTYTLQNVSLLDYGASFRAVARNPAGQAVSRSAILFVVDDTPPTASIISPPEGFDYIGGQTLIVQGSAQDVEDAELGASAFTWRIDFHHDTHVHPALPIMTGVKSVSYVIPSVNETAANVWYRIHLTVQDSAGLTTSVYRDVLPRKSIMRLDTNFLGLRITLDGQQRPTPLFVEGVIGIERRLGAPFRQVVNGVTYEFESWSSGSAREHVVTMPASSATYIARYRQIERSGQISASPNPAVACDGSGVAVATLSWSATGVDYLDVRVGSPSGPVFSGSIGGIGSATTGKWIVDGMVFYLQDRTGNLPLTSEHTLATVTVNVLGCTRTRGVRIRPH